MPKLVVILGEQVGLEYPIRSDVILGRDPRCHVVVGHREISARHARLSQIGGRYYLEDLDSRNGTFVNGRRIQRHALSDGDEVGIGRTAFRFDMQSRIPRVALSSTDSGSGSLTVELDATQDVFKVGPGRPEGGRRELDRDLKLLCDVSRKIGTLSGMKATLDDIAETLLEVFPQAGRIIILLSPDGVGLEPVVTRWRREPDVQPSDYSETIVRKALEERRAILTVDALSDDRFSSSRSVVDLKLRSLMCAPILNRDEPLGVVEIDTIDAGRMFTEQDLNLMTGVVAQVAFAVANARLYDDLSGLAGSTVSALIAALKLRSRMLFSHCERVSQIAVMIGRRLDLSHPELEELRLAGLLHDIGFLVLPDAILPQKDSGVGFAGDVAASSRLEEETWLLLKSHCERGAEILAPIRSLDAVAVLILAHHEHFDGNGYPHGLKGEDIPLGSRILAVADAHDALTSETYYRSSGLPDDALESLKEQAGTQFDPEITELFGRILEARMRLEARRRSALETIDQ